MVLVCEITLAMAQSTWSSVCNNTCNGSEHMVLVCEVTLAVAQSTWS